MRIGLDIGEKVISGALLDNDKIIHTLEKPIYHGKRDPNKIIMDKLLGLIHELIGTQVSGIGLSLPSTYDKKKGIVYDLQKIPYWKKIKIKHILEDEFDMPVGIDNDINCFSLGEKYHGLCKDFKDILCIHMGDEIGVGLIINNKLFTSGQLCFTNVNCLSEAHYHCIRLYKSSYIRTLEELGFICKNFSDEWICVPKHKSWNELGASIGRLISILLLNYNINTIVLGGKLADSFGKYCESMDDYLEKIFPPSVLLNLIITSSQIKNPKPLGATHCF